MTLPIPAMRTLGCRAVEGLTLGHVVTKMQRIPLILPSSPSNPHPKAASFPIIIIIITTVKKEKGRGGGEREGVRREPPSPPRPQQAAFWSEKRPLMKAPQMPLSWWCQPGSPAELQGAHLCSQLAHRSSIKAHSYCQEQRPEGRPFEQ